MNAELFELIPDQPISKVLWLPLDSLHANDYNPNSVAPPEMRLLALSILEDGWTQPIVVCPGEQGGYTIIDGFHRYRTAKENKMVRKMTNGLVPVVVLRKNRCERILATVRHNRARGKHGVSPMADLVAELSNSGYSDAEIMKKLGMDADEVLRLKQFTGLADLFENCDFSESWEV